MKVAFYIGEGGFFNKLIRKWTGSPISHVELIIDDVWYSSSHTDGGVRARKISGKSGNWEIHELHGFDEAYALSVYEKTKDYGYDWTGILGSQILPFGIHWPFHYFCSELVGEMLRIPKPHRYAPHEIKEYLSRESGFFTPKGK
ncbi:conserved hypothetical protein [uncultured Thiomicrorhabdus sp.]